MIFEYILIINCLIFLLVHLCYCFFSGVKSIKYPHLNLNELFSCTASDFCVTSKYMTLFITRLSKFTLGQAQWLQISLLVY